MPDLFSLAVRLTGNPADAEDLVQDTMMRAYRSWNSYELGTDCGAWLRTILKNEFVDRWRRKKNRAEPVAGAKWKVVSRRAYGLELPTGPARFGRPDTSIFGEMIDIQVVEALEGLPPKFRGPVMLVDLYGLSHEEAANQLAVPLGTVKSRLHRARRKLREGLSEYARTRGYGG